MSETPTRKPVESKREAEDKRLDALAREWIDSGEFTPELMTAILDRLGAMAVFSARRVGVPWAASEIKEESWVTFLESGDWEPEKQTSLSTYLYGFVWRIALGVARESHSRRTVSVGDLYDATEYLAQQEATSITTLEDEVDESIRARKVRELDLNALDAALSDLEGGGSGGSGDSASGSSRSRSRSRSRSAGRQDKRHLRGNPRLERIRERAALSRGEMAVGMGLPEWEYRAFETGKRRYVPDTVYRSARQFAENARPPKDFAWLHKATGREVVQKWEKMLGVSRRDPKMEEITGVRLRTLRQWYNATEKTTMQTLAWQGRAHDRVLSYLERR